METSSLALKQAADSFDPIPLWEELSHNMSVIPLNGKKPIEMQWTNWCLEKRPFHRSDFLHHNAGIACGPASGTLVLDIDHPDKFKQLRLKYNWSIPDTHTVQTGSGKYHLYYAYPMDGNLYGCTSYKDPDGELDPKTGKPITIFDVRGIGGQVVGPFSVHPDTQKRYSIYKSLPFAPAPEWLKLLARKTDTESPRVFTSGGGRQFNGNLDSLPISRDIKSLIVNGAPKGQRSEAIISVCNALVWAELCDSSIVSIMRTYDIGEKARGKKSGFDKWVMSQIKKAREYVTETCSHLDVVYYDDNGSGSGFDVFNSSDKNNIYTNIIAPSMPDVDYYTQENVTPQNTSEKQNDDNDDTRRHFDDNMTTTMTTTPGDVPQNGSESSSMKEMLLDSGMSLSDATDICEIANKSCERELTVERLEELCRQLVVTISSDRRQPSSMSSQGNLAADIRQWIEVNEGIFSVNDIYSDLSIKSRDIKKNASKILERMCKDDIIERFGDRRGTFRKVKHDREALEWENCNIDEFDITLPFGIGEMVRIYSTNIIIIAGDSNAGKSALLLNIAAQNMHRGNVHYFSSEMDGTELKARLKDSKMTVEQWRKVKFWKNDENYDQILFPDQINIIDYMEIHNEFYRIGELIKAIHAKLTTGIAIIALQKNEGNDLGRGGSMSKEKSRLYLAVNYDTEHGHSIKIVKLKNKKKTCPVPNPNGLKLRFRMLDGFNVDTDGRWFFEEENQEDNKAITYKKKGK